MEKYILGKKPENKNLTFRNMQILNLVLETNHKGCGTAIAFPYILPDNNSDFASEILSPLLVKITYNSKKS